MNTTRAERCKMQREQLSTIKPGDRRMGFIRTLMYNAGVSLKDLAIRIGITPQMLSYMFNVSDDCYLTTILKMLSMLHIDGKVHLELPNKKKIKGVTVYEFAGNVVVGNRKILPDYIRKVAPDATMRFLAEAMEMTEMTLQDFAAKTGIWRQTISRFFYNDDIKLSSLCIIADALGAKIVWTLNHQ